MRKNSKSLFTEIGKQLEGKSVFYKMWKTKINQKEKQKGK